MAEYYYCCPQCYATTPVKLRGPITCPKCNLEYDLKEALPARKVAEKLGVIRAMEKYCPSLTIGDNHASTWRVYNDEKAPEYYLHILKYLSGGETIQGGILASRRKESNPLSGSAALWGVLWITNLRLIYIDYVDKFLKREISAFDYTFSHIDSIYHKGGGVISRPMLFIVSSGQPTRYVCPKDVLLEKFIADVRTIVSKGEAPLQQETSESANIVSQLERLAELRDKGVLSEAEFHHAKTRLLDSKP